MVDTCFSPSRAIVWVVTELNVTRWACLDLGKSYLGHDVTGPVNIIHTLVKYLLNYITGSIETLARYIFVIYNMQHFKNEISEVHTKVPRLRSTLGGN